MSKYHAKPVTIDGMRFASSKEGKRYGELRLLARAGQIHDLEIQPSMPVMVNGKRVFTYKPDFSYCENGQRVIEDVKGVRTATYKLKKRIVEAIYQVQIRET